MLTIDHAVYAVRDLDEAAARFRRDLGLDSTDGGRHPGQGTANRIVPLGADYLELIAVVDDDEASRSVFGRVLAERLVNGEGWFAVAVATDDVDAVARRLGLVVAEGGRERPDGTVLRWRSAGLDDARRAPWLPFFIQWDVPAELHPGRTRAGHGVRAEGIARIEVAGEAAGLRGWLGGAGLPIRVADGAPAIRTVVLRSAGGELPIR